MGLTIEATKPLTCPGATTHQGRNLTSSCDLEVQMGALVDAHVCVARSAQPSSCQACAVQIGKPGVL